jgi:hypothetical protein
VNDFVIEGRRGVQLARQSLEYVWGNSGKFLTIQDVHSNVRTMYIAIHIF